MTYTHPARTMPYPELMAGLLTKVAADNVSVIESGHLALFKYTPQCVFEKH